MYNAIMSTSHHSKRVFEEKPLVDLTQFPDRIAETFAGKTVFITGATGIVGQALVEKILRCTGVKRIYILIQSKHGQDPHARFAKYFDNAFFGPLLEDRPKSTKKVQVIPGNLSELDVGISREDRRRLVNEVDIMYHCGANTRFDEFFNTMILLNVRGTRSMLTLAKEVKHLQLFVYVSTAYCQPKDVDLEEGPSVSPHDPHEIIRISENIDNESMNILTPKLLGRYGNAYTYSKALSEALVFEQKDKLPILVVRPSIILPCIQHPIPAFTNTANGPLAIWAWCCMNLVYITNDSPNKTQEYIPLDMVINTLLITTYNHINNTDMKVSVCNATNFAWPKRKWYKAAADNAQSYRNLLFPNTLVINPPSWLYFILTLLTQLLPALLIDSAMKLAGIRTKYNFVYIQRKIAKINIALEYFSQCDKWNFRNDVIRTLRMDLNQREDETYALNIEELNLMEYAKNVMANVRKHVLYEKEKHVPKQLLERLKILHYIMNGGFVLGAAIFTYNTVLYLVSSILDYTMNV